MLDRILLEARLILDFCLLGIFKLQFQFYYLWLICSFSLFLVFFPPDSVVGDWTFLRVCPFLLVFHFIGIQLLVVVSYDSLCFCGISYNFSVFISNFIDFGAYHFLMNLAEDLSILFIFSKDQLLVSVIFSIILSIFHLFLLWSLCFFPFY